MSEFTRKFLRPAGDAVLLLVALSAANLLVGRSDPGWLQINPAPFLAVPVLIGARYGFLAGFISGLATAATILGGRFGLIGEIPAIAWTTHPFTLAAFPVLGAVSGELRRLYAAKMRGLEHSNNRFRTTNARLELEVDLLRETNRDLTQQTALHGSELAAMDVELRDILSSGDSGIFANTLEFLRRATGVEEAALFSRKKNSWVQIASTVRSTEDAEMCDIGTAMAVRARKENELVTWAGLWSDKESRPSDSGEKPDPVGPWIAAIPWTGPGTGEPYAVLMVRTMPLHRATWDNFARITTICRWVAGLAVARLSDSGSVATAVPVKARQFQNLLELATATSTDHSLPSALLRLRTKPDSPATNPKAEIAAALRPTDIFTKLDSAKKTVYVALLPLAGQRDANQILSRLKNFTGDVVNVDGQISAAELWHDLTSESSISQNRIPKSPGEDSAGSTRKADASPEAA